MRNLRPLLIALTLVWGGTTGVAAAQPASAAADGGSIERLRDRFAAAQADLSTLDAERTRVVAEHERLAGQIELLKSAGEARLVPGLPDGRLDGLLKSAQRLAEQLADLDRRHAGALAEATAQQRALVAALGEALLAQQAQVALAAPAERSARFAALRSLAAEQAAVSRAVVAPARPLTGLPRVEVADLDAASPDELRELADEAQDHAERVRRQLAQVEARLDDLKARRRVLRAAVAFRRDEALFAEGERNRVTVRGDAPAPGRGTPVTSGNGGNTGNPLPVGEVGTGSPDPSPAPPAENASDGDQAGAPETPGRGSDDFGNSGGGQPDSDGLPGVETPNVDVSPPVAEPVGAGDVFGPTPTGSLGGIDQSLDPALFAGGAEDLSPRGIARQIAAVEAHRKALAASAVALEARRKALEAQAHVQEQR